MKNLITCLVVCVLSGTTFADTWTVDDDGKADFDNIQDAINASSDGDEIVVMPGTYTGTGDVGVVDMSGKRVTLRSTDPDDPSVVAATIIDGENERRCIWLNDVTPLAIKGLTITNGYTSFKGGGIYAANGSPTVADCTFSNNNAWIGGGFYCSGSPYIEKCMFENNTAQEGGAVKLYRSYDPHIISTSFLGNTAESGGAINIDAEFVGGTHVISDCLFNGNVAENGGGLFIYRVDVQMLNNDLMSNVADQGGAMWIGLSKTNIANCLFCNNSPAHIYGAWIDDGDNSFNELCDSSGACCFNMDCFDNYTASECVDAGGKYQGDGSDCSDDPCYVPPTGACCFGLDCFDKYTASECVDASGTYQGNDSDCGDPCPTSIWTVDDDGKADFDNIQAAVDAASAGDEIVVMPGTYTSTQDGHVVNMLGKAVTLRSSDPSDPNVVAATIIDGEEARRGIYCGNGETLNTIIEGFTITNGYSTDYGGGMYTSYNSPTVTNCTFKNNTADYGGGGMSNSSSNSTLTNCTFANNTADNGGGGMYNYSSNCTLTNCTFANNTADNYGGGMYNNENSNPTLTDCTFNGNTANSGGGMYNDESSPILENCTFENNTADVGGGMFNNGAPSLTNCTFTGNTANKGGGMFNSLSSPTVTNCTFTNNTASEDGGGMYNQEYSSPTVTDCTFDSNSATNFGGGMFNRSFSDPTVTNCTFTGNIVEYYSGGGMANHDSTPTLTSTTVCGNTPDQIDGDWTDNGGNTIADVCPIDCTSDINVDGIVDVNDLLILIADWGNCTDNCAGDLNEDGTVDIEDLLVLIAAWGPCE